MKPKASALNPELIDDFNNEGVGIIETGEDEGTIDRTRRPAPDWLLKTLGITRPGTGTDERKPEEKRKSK